jgi:hypothetical protein
MHSTIICICFSVTYLAMAINCEHEMLAMLTPGACTIQHYGAVMYGKWTYFIVSLRLLYCQSQTLALTNVLAYCEIRTLLIFNVL